MNKSYWSYVRQQFRQNRRAVLSLYVVYFLVFVAVFADFLANEKPIIAKYQGQWAMPSTQAHLVEQGWSKWDKAYRGIDWETVEFDFAIRALIPYSPDNQDSNNNYKSPFEKQEVKSWHWRHWMGTASSGQDVAAGMIHGTRIALSVGILAMSIAACIGILLGGLAGFFGDTQLKVSKGRLISMSFFGFWAVFYAFIVRWLDIANASSFSGKLQEVAISLVFIIVLLLVGFAISKLLEFIPFFKRLVTVPLDIVISRIIEIFNAIPALIFILAFVALVQTPSIFQMMVIIGLVSWTSIARFIRAELLKIRALPYIEAAQALGYSQWRIMFRHAIPNGLSPVLITVAFGIAASILVEATLSYLGLSNNSLMSSWGGILKLSRDAPSEWWLAVFPGFAIFITVACFNFIGDGLRDALDPKLKK